MRFEKLKAHFFMLITKKHYCKKKQAYNTILETTKPSNKFGICTSDKKSKLSSSILIDFNELPPDTYKILAVKTPRRTNHILV